MTPRPAVRWAVPAALAVLVAVGTTTPWRAAADADLPDRTAEQLLADLAAADVDGLSGTLVHRADLGLPALPGASQDTDPTALLAGEHSLRVWYAGPDKARVALEGRTGELDLRTDGDSAWVWSSVDRTATHVTLPAERPGAAARPTLPPVTPDALADLVLTHLEPTTRVTTGEDTVVAGRAAYQLVVTPAAQGSLVGSIRIAVDAAEHVPTRVQVFPAGSDDPALEVAFTRLSTAVPSDDVFAFAPPEGATVKEIGPADLPAMPTAPAPTLGALPHPDVTVVGEGWTSVVAVQAAQALRALEQAASGPSDDAPRHGPRADVSVGAFLAALPQVQGDWGSGRVLESRLFTVLLTDDGRVLAGAVDAATLEAAAADPTTR